MALLLRATLRPIPGGPAVGATLGGPGTPNADTSIQCTPRTDDADAATAILDALTSRIVGPGPRGHYGVEVTLAEHDALPAGVAVPLEVVVFNPEDR